MYIIYGIAAMTICCVIQFVAAIVGFSAFDGDTVLFLGAYFASSFVSKKMMQGLVKSNQKNTKTRHLICIASGVVTFVALYYMEFRAQVLIGNARMPGGCTFYDYIINKMDYVDVSIITKHGRIATFPTSGVPNYIIFMLQIVVSILGARTGCIRDNTYYCDECNKYYKTEKLFSATQSDLGQIIKSGEIKIAGLKKLEDFMSNHKVTKDNKNKNMKYTGLLCYCENCNQGKLVIENKSYDHKNQKEFKEKFIELDKSWVEGLKGKNNNKYNF